MRVFVTGASGWIGSATVPELRAAGHEVIGLARSDRSAAALAEAGAEVRRGDLDDLDVLRSAAAEADGVIHLAFKHDIAFTGQFAEAAAADRSATEALGEALAGSGKPLVLASGLLGVKPGQLVTEEDGHGLPEGAASGPAARQATAEYVLGLAGRGVRSSIVRLSPTVHGEGDQGFVRALAATAREKGVAGYLGDGSNRWPAVHRSDAARLFRLALEQAEPGTTLHAAGEEAVRLGDVAAAIAAQLGIGTAVVPAEEAAAHFGWLAPMVSLDSPASSAATQERIGWKPEGPGLVEDIENGRYTG